MNEIYNLEKYTYHTQPSSTTTSTSATTASSATTATNDDKPLCTICLHEVTEGKILPCGHVFHLFCIKEWMATNENCPSCKAKIINENGHMKYSQTFYRKEKKKLRQEKKKDDKVKIVNLFMEFKEYNKEMFAGDNGEAFFRYLQDKPVKSYFAICHPEGFTCPIAPLSSVGISS